MSEMIRSDFCQLPPLGHALTAGLHHSSSAVLAQGGGQRKPHHHPGPLQAALNPRVSSSPLDGRLHPFLTRRAQLGPWLLQLPIKGGEDQGGMIRDVENCSLMGAARTLAAPMTCPRGSALFCHVSRTSSPSPKVGRKPLPPTLPLLCGS